MKKFLFFLSVVFLASSVHANYNVCYEGALYPIYSGGQVGTMVLMVMYQPFSESEYQQAWCDYINERFGFTPHELGYLTGTTVTFTHSSNTGFCFFFACPTISWEERREREEVGMGFRDYLIRHDLQPGSISSYEFGEPSATLRNHDDVAARLGGRTVGTDSAEVITIDIEGDKSYVVRSGLDTDVPGVDDGTVSITSDATVTEEGTTIYIENNNTVETNIELGDAPEQRLYDAPSAVPGETVTSFESEFSTGATPDFVYIIHDIDEYEIDTDKLFTEVFDKFNAIFPISSLFALFNTQSGANLPVIRGAFVAPFIDIPFSFTLNMPMIAQSGFVVIVRLLLGFFIIFETVLMSVSLFS